MSNLNHLSGVNRLHKCRHPGLIKDYAGLLRLSHLDQQCRGLEDQLYSKNGPG
mgnify:CR=1 FL=1